MEDRKFDTFKCDFFVRHQIFTEMCNETYMLIMRVKFQKMVPKLS